MFRCICYILIVNLLVLKSSVASADQQKTALNLYQKAKALYKEANYREAIQRYEESFAISKHPNTLYYIAESYRRLGKLRKSNHYYEEYSKTLDGEKQREFREKIRKVLQFGRKSTVYIATIPGGATVRLDGTKVGITPDDGSTLQFDVDGGEHELSTDLDSHYPIIKRFTSEFGEPVAYSLIFTPSKKDPLLVVLPNVEDAIVKFDKSYFCTAPMRMSIKPGKHHIEVYKDNHSRFKKTFTVELGEEKTFRPFLTPTTLIKEGPEDDLEAQNGKDAASRLYVYAMGSVGLTSYGADRLDSSVSSGGGIRTGYLFRFGPWGAHLDFSAIYIPAYDETSEKTIRTRFLLTLGGVGLRFYPLRRFKRYRHLWLGARLSVGMSLLVGASRDSIFFKNTGVKDAHGVFSLFALRPELVVGWELYKGITILAAPAFDYNPRLDSFNPEINRIFRYQLTLGLGLER